MPDKVRILRIVEYTGDRAAIEQHFKNVLKGEKTFEVFTDNRRDTEGKLGSLTIRAATLGEFPEILEES